MPILLCACSVQGQQTKRHDEAQDGVMIIRDDGYPEPGLHDVQHPAQNTLASPGLRAAISMGRERERDSRGKCHGEPREEQWAQRHCYTLETHCETGT